MRQIGPPTNKKQKRSRFQAPSSGIADASTLNLEQSMLWGTTRSRCLGTPPAKRQRSTARECTQISSGPLQRRLASQRGTAPYSQSTRWIQWRAFGRFGVGGQPLRTQMSAGQVERCAERAGARHRP